MTARAPRLLAATRVMRAQIAADLRNVTREGLLVLVAALPLAAAFAIRFAIPDQAKLEALVNGRLAAALEPHRALLQALVAGLEPMVMGLFVGAAPGLVGAVYGLLLVDERDERTLAAVRVTPEPFARYMAGRMLTPCVLATAMTAAAYPIAGLAPLPLGTVAAISIAGASVVPVVALAIVAFAPNKLGALVMVRLTSVALMLPVFAHLGSPAQARLAWPIPSYWQMKALWLALDGATFWPTLLVAPALNAALTVWLYRRFERRSEL